MYRNSGDYVSAKDLYQKAFDLNVEVSGENDTQTLSSLNELANMYNNYFKDYKKAIELYQQSLELNVKTYGEKNFKVTAILNTLSNIYRTIGNIEKANELYERAAKIRKSI